MKELKKYYPYAYNSGRNAYLKHHNKQDWDKFDARENGNIAGSNAWFAWWQGWHSAALEITERVTDGKKR